MTTHRIRNILPVAALLAGCGWLQYGIYFNDDDGRQKIAALKARIAEHKRLNEEMSIRNAALRESLLELKSNPEHVEELARKWLFMIKPGEVYVVPAEER